MKYNSTICLRSALIACTTVLLSSPLAFSGGYEKPTSFSGKWGALGGAASSSVSGAEALFFNPAGLAGGESTAEITGDFSPTWISFSGPLAGNADVKSNSSFVPAFGAFASFKPTPKWGIAVGTYLSGGAKAVYENVDFTNSFVAFGDVNKPGLASSNATIQSNLSIIEVSVGTGYEVIDGLRIGIGYRMASVHASVSAYGADPTKQTLTTLTIDNISGTAWNGFRLGAQYYPKESRWGVGLNWRTAVSFTGTGNVSGAVTAATSTSALAAVGATAGKSYALDPTQASVSNTFPQQFDVGGHYDIIPSGLRAHVQYTFTNYSVDQNVAVAGNATFTPVPTVPASFQSSAIPSIPQNWLNEHDLRFGFDYFEIPGWVFRAGYVLSSQVTPADRARATFTPPGMGHTIAVGAGTSFLNNSLETNVALEYGFSSADTTNSGAIPAPDQTSGALGVYKASDFAGHVGVTYRM